MESTNIPHSESTEIWKYQDQEVIPKEVLAKTNDEQILEFAQQERMEWEASQGAGFQPPEDSEREEVIMERYEDLIKRRDTQEKRDKIEDVLKSKAA